jgi:hypothetical protein
VRSGYVAPVEDYFAGVAGAHGSEAIFVVAPVHAVSDDGGDVEAGLEHDGHHVPGLVHLAAVDSAEGELVEDDLVPVDGDLLGGDSEHGDLASVAHVSEHVTEGRGVAGHLKSYIKSFVHVQLSLDFIEGYRSRVYGAGHAYFFGKFATVLVGIGDDDVTRAGVTDDGCSHDSDRAGSGDEDVFAEDREGERGVDGVAEGIEDGGYFERDAGRVLPDVGHGQDDELGEGSVAIDSDTHGVGAEVATASETVAAAAADYVAFAGDDGSDGEVFDVGADGDDFADEFVADDEAGLDDGACPGVPLVDVEVGAADAGVEYADLYVVDADFGLGNVFEPEAAFCAAFYECLHGECLSVRQRVIGPWSF